jgi:hypothetical protein
MTATRHRLIRTLRIIGAAASLVSLHVAADQHTVTGGVSAGLTTQSNLDFVINLGKFVFLRVGTGTYPTASGTEDTVTFALTPSIPPGVTPTTGSNQGVAWNATAPTSAIAATNAVLPVEVRSNAGTISLTATATKPLSSGTNTIPLSQITITSSDANLPPPPVPNAGVGTAVTVTGTSFSNLVTQRSANWTFAYAGTPPPAAGSYSGTITFTASSP